ncbi:hypothetical protein HELRODRAFT_105715 [Helobdella robusta]|uniref:Transmembrane protein 144 n=1 Tax=Helobdella robusta TaxID=6412 RepID=T1EDX1_HELRO|nr:hypothetical protein HELRODRAFT_105715 [Helobdella robusta]ESO13066.1 hypothetical protein HELRODRAFT_105715 [Helobdella robusta]
MYTELITVNFTIDITTVAPAGAGSSALGYVAVLVAVLFFGSNFLPVKKFYSGNGIFFQWVLCSGVWSTGVVCFAIRGFPAYRPLSMIGGWLWCTGNMMTVPIINGIGLAKGLLVWGAFNLLTGWASSRFVCLSVCLSVYLSVCLSVCTYNFLYIHILFIVRLSLRCSLLNICFLTYYYTSGTEKPDVKPDGKDKDGNEIDMARSADPEHATDHPDAFTSVSSSSSCCYRCCCCCILCTGMAVLAGVFYGLTFIPTVYLKNRFSDYSQNGLDYVFPHYCGIYCASTVYFLIYCAIAKNTPVVYSNIILPGFVAGLMWGIANIAWFIANDSLSESISFPIITTLPGIIGTIWGLLFREIKGWKNYLVLGIAISIGIVGSILTGLSK